MTDSPATSAEEGVLYASLQVLRVEPRFRALMANEKVVARQEFMGAFDRGAERVATDAFILTGLSPLGDLAVLRVSRHLADLHAAVALLADAGLGRHLTPTDLYLGTLKEPPARQGRMFCAIPLTDAPRAGAPKGATLSILDGAGLGSASFMALLRSEDALAGRNFLKALGKSAAAPVLTGLHSEIRDIVDTL
ncbi:MAG: hypothetical protein HY928_09370 [Elusimicrobia bacterium]|nr:hypothetical protein [Elusimicrobiota bacterium]